ncbi:MAG: hypothetical protein R2873_28420 [Caldilineaceae bacterium]
MLDEVGKLAKISRLQVGFETLRWTCAVRDFRNGMPPEQIRNKMGLSKVSGATPAIRFTGWQGIRARSRMLN